MSLGGASESKKILGWQVPAARMISTNRDVGSERHSSSLPSDVDQYEAIDQSAVVDKMRRERSMIMDRGSRPEPEPALEPESELEPTQDVYERGTYVDTTKLSRAGHPLPHLDASSLDPSVSNRSWTAVPGNVCRGSLDGQPVVLRVDQDGLEILPGGDTGEGSTLMIRFELLDEFRPTPVRCSHPILKLLPPLLRLLVIDGHCDSRRICVLQNQRLSWVCCA